MVETADQLCALVWHCLSRQIMVQGVDLEFVMREGFGPAEWNRLIARLGGSRE